MLRRTAMIATLAVLLAAAGPAVASPRVTFTKWALQIARAGVVQNASHPQGEPQFTCPGDTLRFAGVAGRYRGFPQGATIVAVFLLDGGKVARERYVVDDHGTFGLSWQPKTPVPIAGDHLLELRILLAGRLTGRSRLHLVGGDC